MKTAIKRITLKKLNEIHPDFEVTRHLFGSFDVKHKPTGKTVVCILGKKITDIDEFISDVENNPGFYLNQKSYFRNTTPTHESPYTIGGKVRIIATQEELDSHFGTREFCHTGHELVVKSSHWSGLSDEWQPSFEYINGPGGFWLKPWMVEVIS